MLYFLHHLITHLLDITHSQTNTSNCNDFGSLWFYPSLGFTPLERCDNYCIWCTCKRVICVEIWSIKLISLIIILIFLLFLVCTLNYSYVCSLFLAGSIPSDGLAPSVQSLHKYTPRNSVTVYSTIYTIVYMVLCLLTSKWGCQHAFCTLEIKQYPLIRIWTLNLLLHLASLLPRGRCILIEVT